jgi:hypothetical protein
MLELSSFHLRIVHIGLFSRHMRLHGSIILKTWGLVEGELGFLGQLPSNDPFPPNKMCFPPTVEKECADLGAGRLPLLQAASCHSTDCKNKCRWPLTSVSQDVIEQLDQFVNNAFVKFLT